MAGPTRVGSTIVRHSFTTGPQSKVVDIPAGTQPGDTLIFFAEWGGGLPGSGTGGNDWPSGWSNIEHENHGTRGYTLWHAGLYSSGSTLTVTFNSLVSGSAEFSLMSLRNAAPFAQWTIGGWWDRNGLGGGVMNTTTRALGIAAPSNSLVLSFHGEATNATETSASSISGASKWFESGAQVTSGTLIERVYVAYREVTTAETTPNVDVIWPNSAQNGAAMQVAIPVAVVANTPQVGGTQTVRHASTSPLSIGISAVPVGGWMIVSAMSSASSMNITPPTDWVVLVPRETTGTRRNFIFGKIKEAGDGTTADFTASAANTAGYAFMWGTNSGPISTWVIGATDVRGSSGEPAGSRYTNRAPALTTINNDNLVIAVTHEATLAKSQAKEITSFTSGWTERLWLEQVSVNDQIETIWMGTKEVLTPGSSGDATFTYVSPQDNNGWAMQIALSPPGVAIPTIPEVVGTPTTFTGNVLTDFTINRPATVMNDDYIIVVIRGQNNSVTDDPTSSGFTRLGPAFVPNSVSSRLLGFYGRPVVNALTEPTSYTFTVPSSATSNSRLVATAFVVRYVDLDTPLAGFNSSYNGVSLSEGRQVTSYTLTTSPALGLFMGASEFTASNDHIPTSTPTGYTLITSQSSSTNMATSRTYLWVGKKEVVTPVDEMTILWGNPTGMGAEAIALRGVASDPPDLEGKGFALADGNGAEVAVYHTTADGARSPQNIVPMRRGFSSVAEMLATPGFTWAHRGGSAPWPEMSLYAYTQSVLRGYGVLEVSLGRTSDGVWFGLHDQTTDRTSGGTYGNASSQTWAQVQAQQIVVGAHGAPQPYMRWEEIVAAYGSTHIIVADPKYALGSYRTEFVNMVNATLGPTRAIIKYSGVGSGAVALSNAAKALGFETWGFFYAADASAALGGSGALQTWGPSWTLIGMDYTASQAVWDEALALGKPIIGHITPSQAAYNTAIAKGASGVQVSGVDVVAPVSWWNSLPYPFVIGSATSTSTGTGPFTVKLPSGTAGLHAIFIMGNAIDQPATPSGWTLVQWSTSNEDLPMGIYIAPATTAAPTFSISQPGGDGGIIAIALKINTPNGSMDGTGVNDSFVSPVITPASPVLVIRTLTAALASPDPVNVTFPSNTSAFRKSVTSVGADGGVFFGLATSLQANAGGTGVAVWSLDNEWTKRASTFIISLT